MRGYYVLENKLGQVVRTFKCESEDLTLVYLKETRRIEAVASTEDLKAQEIEFVELLQTTVSTLQKKSLAVGGVGSLKYLDEIEKVTPSIPLEGDSNEQFKKALKWTAGIQVALLLLIFLIGHFVKIVEEPPQPQLVTVVPRIEPPKPKVQKIQKVVEATEKKVVTKHYTHHVTPHKVTKLAKLRPNVQYRANKNVALNNNGATSIFGALEKSNQDGGVAVNNVRTSRGAGLGGTEGSGGVQTSVYGTGLIGAPLGPQAKASGAGGYGTHGKGGGQAGYGKMSLVGSSNAFFQPVEEEASVEGGLDRDEIAAVIQRHLGQIRFCYEQGLNIKSNLNGRVAIRFFINAGGHVNTANIANTSLHSSDVEGCIVDRLKSWKFPEPRGGVIVKVTYPFVLKRVSQS